MYVRRCWFPVELRHSKFMMVTCCGVKELAKSGELAVLQSYTAVDVSTCAIDVLMLVWFLRRPPIFIVHHPPLWLLCMQPISSATSYSAKHKHAFCMMLGVGDESETGHPGRADKRFDMRSAACRCRPYLDWPRVIGVAICITARAVAAPDQRGVDRSCLLVLLSAVILDRSYAVFLAESPHMIDLNAPPTDRTSGQRAACWPQFDHWRICSIMVGVEKLRNL